MFDSSAFRRFFRCAEGQSILELAVAAPFLLLLLIGTFEIGRYMYDGIEIGNAARAGVAYAALNHTTDAAGIQNAVIADAKELSLATTDVVPTTYCVCDKAQGTDIGSCSNFNLCQANDRVDTVIKVVVSKQFTPLMHYPGLPASLTVARNATLEVSP